MTLATETQVNTFGNYAHLAIQQHYHKALKWEKAVKKDKDPEALHQMRVGMRRLRTAISRFAIAISLPKNVSDRSIGKIARRLGNLRDLDVLKEAVENEYRPKLPKKEQQYLDQALNILEHQRVEVLADVRKLFKESHYQSFKTNLEIWLQEPRYQPCASLPIQEVLADLLLPELSQFFLHPAWLIATEIHHEHVQILPDLSGAKIEQELDSHEEMLHDLRKQAKRLRYQMELFHSLYNSHYADCLAEVKVIQEILGSLQDTTVLTGWLTTVIKSPLPSHLPTLAEIIKDNRHQLWQQWQPLQDKYLQANRRRDFHQTILNIG
ncbi:CHAD domain-containing protein [Calothrix sp. 336/3]|uniref:CHAD domain-containing protein n=1 Tax=Calothrix sp. 336/3 TaxID=1337936 RepID=UPI0004E33BFE|nr:CHAD domain-containing protein [Calothrix sp. 336/3]AKG22931.1 metal-binding protein [Calothrix sp. 336/3]